LQKKILAKHANLEEVKPGQLITAKLDITLANDITGPVAIKEFNKIGVENRNINSKYTTSQRKESVQKEQDSNEDDKKKNEQNNVLYFYMFKSLFLDFAKI
jgi:homoaconitase/3-isopropylmalate dehydratase large subunit